MIWLTSDLHLNHSNIIKYEKESRPFETVEEMNETLITNWNSVVQEDDTVYVLGDFFMGQISTIKKLLPRFKGKIILIRGNHDTKPRLKEFTEMGVEIKEIDYITYKGLFFILSHFPPFNEDFTEMVRENNFEVIHIYGHIHHNAPKGFFKGAYHVGVDTNNLTPVSIDQVWRECYSSVTNLK